MDCLLFYHNPETANRIILLAAPFPAPVKELSQRPAVLSFITVDDMMYTQYCLVDATGSVVVLVFYQ